MRQIELSIPARGRRITDTDCPSRRRCTFRSYHIYRTHLIDVLGRSIEVKELSSPVVAEAKNKPATSSALPLSSATLTGHGFDTMFDEREPFCFLQRSIKSAKAPRFILRDESAVTVRQHCSTVPLNKEDCTHLS
jgi:hypothetical protein